MESVEDSPVMLPLSKERLLHNFHYRPVPNVAGGVGSSSSDSLERHPLAARHYCDSSGLASTPKLSNISGAKTEASSMDASGRMSSLQEGEEDRSRELSVSLSNTSNHEREWVEQEESGVYITIQALLDGVCELRRARFNASVPLYLHTTSAAPPLEPH